MVVGLGEPGGVSPGIFMQSFIWKSRGSRRRAHLNVRCRPFNGGANMSHKSFALVVLCGVLTFAADKKDKEPDPFVDKVVEFKVGPGGGFNSEKMPEIVLGCPHGGGEFAGSSHVFSLGRE